MKQGAHCFKKPSRPPAGARSHQHCLLGWSQWDRVSSNTGLWLAGNEGMKVKMETSIGFRV